MKARKFEAIRIFISPIVARFQYARKAAKWRRNNQNNSTTVSEWCPIEKVKVGNYTYGRLNVHWYGQEEEYIEIGNYCSIAGEVHFVMGGEHDYKRLSTFPFSEKIYHNGLDGICKGPIIVRDDVWIGFGSIILSGVTIGQGSVIAAGSIVTKNVPPYSVWIGNRVQKKRFSEEIIQYLERMDFSKLDPEKYKEYVSVIINEDNVEEIINHLTN